MSGSDNNSNEERITIAGIDPDLKKRFKVKCAKADISMTDVLLTMIRLYLDPDFQWGIHTKRGE